MTAHASSHPQSAAVPPIYNVYCVESAHLAYDGLPNMVFGAVWCSLARSPGIAERLRAIRVRHGLPSNFEIKWSKVSPAQTAFGVGSLPLGNTQAD